MLNLVAQPNVDLLQNKLNQLHEAGGGNLNLSPTDIFYQNTDLFVYGNTTIEGNGAIIDFQNDAFGIKILGDTPYSDGTVTINFGDITLVGTNTVWTIDMIGQSILIGEYRYDIIDVVDETTIILASPFLGTNVINETYVIANFETNITFRDLTVQNSTVSLFEGQYCDGVTLNFTNAITGDYGYKFIDSANVLFQNISADDCTTWSIYLDNAPDATLFNFFIIEGAGVFMNKVSDTSLEIFLLQAITGNGITLQNCSNIAMQNFTGVEIVGNGIEIVTNTNDGITIGIGYLNVIGGDGIKLTDSGGATIVNNNFKNITGYGINIENANDINNIISINTFDGSGLGAVNDLGTTTLIRSNSGVADN